MGIEELRRVAQALDAGTAQSFVRAARHVLDALAVEGARARDVQTPAPRDYRSAGISRAAPAGGWIGNEELRDAARRIGEAIAAEKWVDGVVFALRALQIVGA